jgi:hypothetical protein
MTHDAASRGNASASCDGPSVSSLVCPRCGGFTPSLVRKLEVCRECGDKVLPPALRGTLTFGGLAAGTWHVLTRVGPRCAAIALLFGLPGDLLLWLLPEAPLSLQIGYFTFVTLLADLAIMVLAHEALHGRTMSLADAFVRGVPAYGAVIGARLRAGLLTLLWALLLVLPALYKSAAYSLASQVALFEPRRAHEATEVSIARTRGVVWLLVVSELVLYTISVGVPLGATVLFELGTLELASTPTLSDPRVLALDVILGAISTLALALLLIVQQVVYDKTAVEDALATSELW